MKQFLIFLLVIAIVGAIVLRVRYGGGVPYQDLSTTPVLEESALQEVLSYPEPIGNVAVSLGGRVFFTVHPESRPQGNKLLEWRDGAAVPYPSGSLQPNLFDTVLGIVVDRQNWLWTIDHGNHGFGTARLLAFDIANGDLMHEHEFLPEIAPAGSMLQDLQVSEDSGHVIIADASIWRQNPALIVYDVASQSARRVLESHESVSAQNLLVRNSIRNMTFLGGIFSLKAGVDGIAVSPDNMWLYYGAVNNSGLYRIRMSDLTNPGLPPSQLDNRIERFSDKPLSNGFSADVSGNIYVTDVEHNSVAIVGPDKQLNTLIRSSRVRWPEALSYGPGGWLYLSDSALPEQVLKSKDHIRLQSPYRIYRFKSGYEGIPGH